MAKQDNVIRPGSRWLSNVDGKTVVVVLESKGFDRYEIKTEGRMVFGSTLGRNLRASFSRLEGRSADMDLIAEPSAI
jgi:hypothetical protein